MVRPEGPPDDAPRPDPEPETLDRLRLLFREALRRADRDRVRYLDEHCPDDPALRAEVEQLLEAAADAHPALPADDPESAEDASSTLPERIGNYRILELLGRGGMGVVYRARQSSPARDVALKVLQPGFVHSDMLQRFAREAELLGALQHPHIATVFDAGSADTGFGALPFFAMELVDGQPLDRYARDHRLDAAGSCQLILQACNAMQHAHEHGVVHRDLKPGNVLVATDGHGAPRVKILDFGIARSSLADPASGAAHRTLTGQVFGTLPYMSPEQLDGRSGDADPRTDVYALGVMLHELLAGKVPLPVADLPLTDAAQMIREVDATPLRRVQPDLPKDLETIVACALEKSPDRRYPSARALAADLERFLDHRPIEARPASRLYRLQKFVRRNRTPVYGFAATTLTLVAGLVGMTLLADSNRRLADREHNARRELTETLYSAQMKDAVPLLLDPQDTRRLRQLVAAWPDPEPGEPDLRAWEYDLLVAATSMEAAVHDLGRSTGRSELLPDGRLVVVRDARLVTVDIERPLVALYPPFAVPRLGALEIAARSGLIAWATTDGTLAVAAPQALREPWTFSLDATMRGREAPFADLAVDPAGCYVAVFDRRSEHVLVVDRDTDQQVARFDAPGSRYAGSMSFSTDGTLLALLDATDPQVTILSTADWSPVQDLPTGVLPGLMVRFAPVGHRLALGLRTGPAEVLDLDAGTRERFGTLEDGAVRVLSWSADGRRLAVGSEYGAARVHEPGGGPSVTLRGHERTLSGLSLSSDGGRAYGSGQNGLLLVWDLERTPPTRLLHPEATNGGPLLHWSSKGSAVVIGRQHLGGRAYDPRTGRPVDAGQPLRHLSPDLSRYVSRDADRIEVRSSRDGARIATIPFSTDEWVRWEWSPDSERIVTAVGERLQLFDAATGAAVGPAHPVHQTFRPWAWSRDGRWLARGTTHLGQAAVALHDGRDGRLLRHLEADLEGIHALCFAPDGQRLAVATRDGPILILSTADGTLLGRLVGLPARADSLDWHVDGNRLVSCGGGALRIWDVDRGRSVLSLPDFEGIARWSPDGRTLAINALTGEVRIWHAPPRPR